MDPAAAQALAERLHADDREEDGTPLLEHVRRVAAAAPPEALALAWVHEVLEWTPVSERELLDSGLTTDELDALRLLTRTTESRFDERYIAHLELIANAPGRSGALARAVKLVDLEDRSVNPFARDDGWSPPYREGIALLREAASR
jgi:hypothetical protein